MSYPFKIAGFTSKGVPVRLETQVDSPEQARKIAESFIKWVEDVEAKNQEGKNRSGS